MVTGTRPSSNAGVSVQPNISCSRTATLGAPGSP
jgi:hypothetical protein